MTTGAIEKQRIHGSNLDAEVEWLRSFHYSDLRICQRLGITLDTLHQRDWRRKRQVRE